MELVLYPVIFYTAKRREVRQLTDTAPAVSGT
jgi:hypothetical protein